MKFFLRNHPHWALALVSIIFAACYWGVLATGRYVSESHIVLQSPEVNPTGFNMSQLLSGTTGAGELLLLKDHLKSVDMLQKLQAQLDLRGHFSDSKVDFLSRMSDRDVEIEKFYQYMQQRIEIEYDDYSAVLRIKVQAFTPEMAQKINQTLLTEGERHMNQMGQRLAQEQVDFIETQVIKLEQRLLDDRQALLDYQNKHGLVSPTGAVTSIATIVGQLQTQLALAEARRISLSSFQSLKSAEIVRLDGEISALKQQINVEKSKMATQSGDALNRISAEYQTLELRASFALNLYSNSLLALETTRVEAARKLKQVSVLQNPTLPEFSIQPKRLYSLVVFALFALFTAAIIHLIRAIVLEHRD